MLKKHFRGMPLLTWKILITPPKIRGETDSPKFAQMFSLFKSFQLYCCVLPQWQLVSNVIHCIPDIPWCTWMPRPILILVESLLLGTRLQHSSIKISPMHTVLLLFKQSVSVISVPKCMYLEHDVKNKKKSGEAINRFRDFWHFITESVYCSSPSFGYLASYCYEEVGCQS